MWINKYLSRSVGDSFWVPLLEARLGIVEQIRFGLEKTVSSSSDVHDAQ
jgi:hypothetical protein